jgi:hypothetical protein
MAAFRVLARLARRQANHSDFGAPLIGCSGMTAGVSVGLHHGDYKQV